MTLTEEEEYYIHIITKFLVPIMFSIIILVGSIGNILVIYVVSQHFKINKINSCLFIDSAKLELDSFAKGKKNILFKQT